MTGLLKESYVVAEKKRMFNFADRTTVEIAITVIVHEAPGAKLVVSLIWQK